MSHIDADKQNKLPRSTWPAADADRPLESIANDKLGRKDLTTTIARTILRYPKEETLVLGLYGPWGYGKTTILNFVKEYIERIKKKAWGDLKQTLPDVIYFDPWVFANQEEIIEIFLENLIDGLQDILGEGRSRKIKYRATIKSAQKWLYGLEDVGLVSSRATKLLKWFGRLLTCLKSSIFGEPKLTERRKEMNDAMKSLKNKVVVIIDEIDRLNKHETKILFQLVKATFNLPNIIFVLAFDIEKVAELVSEGNGKILDGREYIEKIVQMPFPIPPPDRASFERFIQLQLNKVIYFVPDSSFDKTRWSEIYNFSGLRNILLAESNPRKVIRFCNSIKGHLYSLQNRVDPIDFIAIGVIKYFHPAIYEFLSLNTRHLVEDGEQDMSRMLKPQDARQRFQDALDEAAQGDVRNLIDKLFPSLTSGHYAGFIDQWIREKRICSWRNIHTYFYLKQPEGTLIHHEMERFIRGPKTIDEFVDILESEIADDSLPTFLRDLGSYIESIATANARNLIIALFNIAEKFPPHYRDHWVVPDSIALLMVRRILRNLGKVEASHALSFSFSNTLGLSLPFSLVDSWGKSIGEGTKDELEIEENMLSLFKRDLVSRAEELSKSSQLRSIRYLSFVLDRWYDWSDKKFKMQNFIDAAIDNDEYLPALVVHYVLDRTHSGSDGTFKEYKFDFESLAKLGAEMVKIYNKAKAIALQFRSSMTKEQSRALKLYIMDYPKYSETKKNPDNYRRDDEII